MEARTKAAISFFMLVILIGTLYVFTDWFSKVTGYVLGENEKVKLAQCLNEKNAVLYTSSTCPSCVEQRGLFGEAVRFIETFECDNAETCPAERGVPAWKIGGEFYYGLKEIDELKSISKCYFE